MARRAAGASRGPLSRWRQAESRTQARPPATPPRQLGPAFARMSPLWVPTGPAARVPQWVRTGPCPPAAPGEGTRVGRGQSWNRPWPPTHGRLASMQPPAPRLQERRRQEPGGAGPPTGAAHRHPPAQPPQGVRAALFLATSSSCARLGAHTTRGRVPLGRLCGGHRPPASPLQENAQRRRAPRPSPTARGKRREPRGPRGCAALLRGGGDGRSPIAGKGGARPASGSAGSLPRPGSHPRCPRPPPVHLSPPSRSLTQRTRTEVLLVPQSHTSHSVRNEASNPAWPLPPPRGQVGGLWVLPTPPWAAEQCKAPAWDGGAGSVPARQRQLVPRRRTADPPPARASS